MKIAVVGAGSIGLLLGSFFSEMDFTVTMFTRRKEQSEVLREKGIRRINIDQSETTHQVSVTTNLNELVDANLIVIAVKYAELEKLLIQLEVLKIEQPILFVQNGIGHYHLALATKFPAVGFGSIEHGALKMDDCTVSHNGVGYLTVGMARGTSVSLNKIAKRSSEHFPVKINEDVARILLRKVLINCMINPLTAILQVNNGELLTNEYCRSLLTTLYEELSDAFPMSAIGLSLDEVMMVCDNTKHNQSSMLADRLAGRKMEIETIVSAVIKKANEEQKTLPILMMLEKMLYAVNGRGEAEC